MELDDHVEQVRQWLKAHVQTSPTPQAVKLTAFRVRTKDYSGSFNVWLDATWIPRRFEFGLGGSGEPTLYVPMFHSPLGAPASYAAVQLTEQTEAAITALLSLALPPMKPLGWNRDTGESVYESTHPPMDRIVDPERYAETMRRITTKGYSVSMPVPV